MGSVTAAAEQDSMWYEYEPLLTSPVRMTCSPERLPNPFPQSYPSFATNSHSGPMNYPSYRAYLGGMVDYDYFYQGYKHSLSAPEYRQTSLSSLPFRVNFRWTNYRGRWPEQPEDRDMT